MQNIVTVLDTLLINLTLSFLGGEGPEKNNKLFFGSFKLVCGIKSKTRFLRDSIINFLNIVLLINFTLIIS